MTAIATSTILWYQIASSSRDILAQLQVPVAYLFIGGLALVFLGLLITSFTRPLQ